MSSSQPANQLPPQSVASGSTRAPPQAPAQAPVPAHPAFPSIAPSSSRQLPIPTNSRDILNLISNTDSIAYIDNVLLPALNGLLNGTPFEGAKLKEKERRQLGEETLACKKEDIYGVDDAQVMGMSAGLIYVISARLNTFRKSAAYNDELFTFAIRLSSFGDPVQLNRIPSQVTNFAWGLLRLAQHVNKVPLAVQAMQTLIPNSCFRERFSGVYAAFLEACLLTRDFEAATLVLNNVFLEVKASAPSYLDVLTFYHHAGLIFAATKQFDKAKQHFITAVSLPTATASAIQLASAKRAILCELIDTGKRITFPKYTSHSVTRAIEKNTEIYIDLAKDYENGKWDAVRITAKKPDFAQDCNRGLLDQVTKSITKRRIVQLREVYSRLTINDLVARVGPSSQETVETVTAILGEMIASGAIDAAIIPGSTPATSVVTFTDSRPDSTTSGTAAELAEVTQLASRLEAELTEASRVLGVSKEYLKKQASLLETGAKSAPGGAVFGGGKSRPMDEYDQLMAAEEAGERTKGPGGNYADMGY